MGFGNKIERYDPLSGLVFSLRIQTIVPVMEIAELKKFSLCLDFSLLEFVAKVLLIYILVAGKQ